jgi:uncharacterized protein YdhG (YjbR/CyaY superfamily)
MPAISRVNILYHQERHMNKAIAREGTPANTDTTGEASIDEYIAAQRTPAQERLRLIRSAFAQALPDAQERISWRMPTYWQGRNIIHFASFQHHIGIYPGDKAVTHFAAQLQEFRTGKGSIVIDDEQDLPLELLTEMAVWCLSAYGK